MGIILLTEGTEIESPRVIILLPIDSKIVIVTTKDKMVMEVDQGPEAMKEIENRATTIVVVTSTKGILIIAAEKAETELLINKTTREKIN